MKSYFLFLAWLVAVIGVTISIFVGEILGHHPCPLCWYQRMALFPLAILLGIATYRNDAKIIPYGLTLAFIGLIIASYQALTQKYPALDLVSICGENDDCASPVFTLFGFLTFPILSAIGFFLIIAFLFSSMEKTGSKHSIH